MVRRRGPRLTLAEKTQLWRRWRRGAAPKTGGFEAVQLCPRLA